jgi:phosphomannomutase
VFVEEKGAMIGSDMITAVLAEDFLKRPENKGATVVYDLRSSHVGADVVKQFGGVPKRDRVGHAFIKKTMAETKAIFGGELSGHIYFRDYYYADSAAVAFARVLSVISEQSRPLSEIIAPLYKYTQSGELNFQIEDKDGKIREIADAYKKAQVDYLDGITVDNGDWWFNVRKSNTEPMLRLNLEAASAGQLREKLAELKKFLGEPVHGH